MRLGSRAHYILFCLLLYFKYNSQDLYSKIAQLEKKFDSTHNPKEKALIKIKLSQHYSKVGENKKGIKAGYFSLNYANINNNDSINGLANLYLGSNFINQNKDSATNHYNLALKAYRHIGDSIQVSNVYNNLGLIKYFESNFSEALNYYLISLKIKEVKKDSVKIGWNYNAIGTLYFDLNNLNEAIYYLNKGIVATTKVKDTRILLMCKGNLANVYKEQKNYNKALPLYKEILFNAIKYGYKEIEAEANLSIGTIFEIKKDYEKAILYCNKSINVSKNSDIVRVLTTALAKKAECLSKINQFTEAKIVAYQALTLNPLPKQKSELFFALYKIYTKNNSDSALKYLLLNMAIKDSLVNDNIKIETSKMAMKYDTDKKIELNNLKNEKKLLKQKEIREKQKLMIYFSLFILIILVLFTIIIFKRLKQSKIQNQIINSQKLQVEQKNREIEEKQKEILDSIRYAKRIQQALLPNKKIIEKGLKK